MHLPGSGVGGHCLPKDTWLLRYGLQKYGEKPMETEFICLARRINDYMPTHMAEMIEGALKRKKVPIRDAKIAILGVAYLEDSDDTRNTPAYSVIRELESRGAEVVAHDPHVRDFPEVELTRELDVALSGADCIAIVTKHKEYFRLDLSKTRQLMRTPLLVDGRNVIDRKKAERAGFHYKGIGKGK